MDILGVVDHELCLAPLNLELPPLPAEVSLGRLIEDDLVVQPDGDVSEAIGDVTGHHCAAASRHRQDALGAVSHVPACVEKMSTHGQDRAARQLLAAPVGSEAGAKASKRQDGISHTDCVRD